MTDNSTPQIAELTFRNTLGKVFKTAADAQDLKGFQKAFCRHVAKASKTFCKTVADFSALRSVDWTWASASDASLAANLKDGGNVESAMLQQLDLNSAIGPFEALVLSEFLLRNSAAVAPQLLAAFVVRLATFQAADSTDEDSAPPDASLPDEIVRLGEAPFVVGLLLSFLKMSKPMLQSGRSNLAKCLADSTDKDGTLHGEAVGGGHYIFASYVRVASWADAFKETWASPKTTSLWRMAIAQAAAACDDKGLVLDAFDDSRQISTAAILKQGSELAGFEKSSFVFPLLATVVGKKKPLKMEKKKARAGTSAGSSQSDWAATATLRSGLLPGSDLIGLSWSSDRILAGVSCMGKRLLTGDWTYSIKVGGEQHTSMGEWVCTCWFNDDDVAFVELEKGTADGTRHVRHVMLSTTEHLALFVDTVTCSDADASVEFTSQLGCVSRMLEPMQSNPITRELRGGLGAPELRIIPTWLDDDRLINAAGNCSANEEGIHMSAQGIGGATVPLIIDWNPKRTFAEADWNRLTVTEDRKVLTQHEAGGYRVRIGTYQLLIFRSLRPGNKLRAVLGYNTSNESIYGRIANSGMIDPLVMVEGEA